MRLSENKQIIELFTNVQTKLKFQLFLSNIRENRINMKSDKMCLLYLEFLELRLFSDLNKTLAKSENF